MKRVAERQATNQIYLLRLWREPQDGIWRASLKTTADDQEIAFANLDELFVYLLRQTEAMEKPRRKLPLTQGEKVMTTDFVRFIPQEEAIHFVIGHDAIGRMIRMGEAMPNDEALKTNGDLLTWEIRLAKLANTNIASRIGYAFAFALIRRRADIHKADTGDGIYWPIRWDVFSNIAEIALKGGEAYEELVEYIMSEMELLVWEPPTN